MNLESERGSVAIQVGVMMTVIIGMLALGVEITFVLYKHRQMQSAADSAALGGATALRTGYPDFRLEAQAIAASLGFVGGAGGATVTINNPPASGPRATDDKAVEVIISQPQTLTMVGLLSSPLFNVGARSVATTEGGGGIICILQWGGTAPNPAGILIDRGAVVNLARDPDTNTCGVAANSTSPPPSLLVRGGATLNTQSVSVSGTVQTSGGGAINSTEPIEMNQPAVADPYADVAMPPPAANCLQTNYTVPLNVHNLPAGLYCGNLTIGSNRTVTMNGTYFIGGTRSDRRAFNIRDNAVVTTGPNGVTIILTARSGSNYEQFTVSNSAQVTLTAPTTGPLAGIVLFGDRSAPRSTTHGFIGDSTLHITGAIYLPTQTVQVRNSSRLSSNCTQLIAAAIDIQATTGWSFKHNCADTGVRTIGGGSGGESKTGLVE